MKRFWCLCVVLVLLVGSGCTNEKVEVYPYFIGIDEYRSGSSLIGPMLYLQSLGIQDQFTVETQDDRQVADSKAAAVFETEMITPIHGSSQSFSTLTGSVLHAFLPALQPDHG